MSGRLPAHLALPPPQFRCSPPLHLSAPLPGIAVPVDEGGCEQEVQVLVDCGYWDGAWKGKLGLGQELPATLKREGKEDHNREAKKMTSTNDDFLF